MILFGEIPSGDMSFVEPGVMHRAERMAKVLHILKVWLFHRQFK